MSSDPRAPAEGISPIVWRLQVHETLPSTSDTCIALARQGEAEGLAVLARRQTAGRGRGGRAWSAPAGNLNLSILLRPRWEAAEAAQWALLAGVALHAAVAPLLSDPSALRLKWPNDLLLDGAKLAGILVESAIGPDGTLDWLVIGIGVNIVAAPSLPERPTTCLTRAGATPAPEYLADAILDRLAHWRAMRASQGFAAIRAEWLRRAHPTGTPLTVRGAAMPLYGEFAGLTETGTLLLRVDGTVRAVASGEIELPPATAPLSS
ncbi:MAG TPA: biotin--[acetyl-CoA-carboxylase] ligase [Acetobacteraceae bacterium]|nr:biotin--[acetyl-CoA-carboxylase] ligase [Acetobacteraceae bacterium]